ncbi:MULTISPECIES: hypothetical protein [Haloferax]|nr:MULTISPECIES: hypothetical protein [Haloferax]
MVKGIGPQGEEWPRVAGAIEYPAVRLALPVGGPDGGVNVSESAS